MRNRQNDPANVPFSIFFDLDLFAEKVAERVLQNLAANTETRPALTIQEAARELSASTDTVRRLIADGTIQAGNVGRSQNDYRIARAEIDRFLKVNQH